MHDEVEKMIDGEVIDRDIVKLPPNDLFDPNVYGSYHYYELVRYKLFKDGMSGDDHGSAYYRITDPKIVESIKNAKFNKGSGSPIRFGHWHFSKDNPGMIELLADGTSPKRTGMLGKVKDFFSDGPSSVVGLLPIPKGVMNVGMLQAGLFWFWDKTFTNIFFEFKLAHDQNDAYVKLMKEVIKDIPEPDPKLKPKVTASQQPTTDTDQLNEELSRIKEVMGKLINERQKHKYTEAEVDESEGVESEYVLDISDLEFDETNQDLVDMGEEPITPEEANALVSCPDDEEETIPAEHQSTWQKLKTAINSTNDRDALKTAFKQVRTAMKAKKSEQNEQALAAALAAETVTVLGIPIATFAFGLIGGLVLLTILGRLLKRIIKGPEPGERGRNCRQDDRRYRRLMNRKYY